MKRKLPIVLSATALVIAVLGVSSPAIAHGVRHAIFAHNADKVDGKHAVAATASITQRRGKLVATSGTTGRLPSNIVPPTAYTTVVGNVANMCANGGGECQVASSEATCPSGKVATGGGWFSGANDPPDPSIDATLLADVPLGNTYFVAMINYDTVNASFQAFAVCAPGTATLAASAASARIGERVSAARAALRN
jgi:hypothetical protein